MARYLHSIACILPPDILERVILEGTPEQRRAALNTLSTDNALRSLRAQNAIIRGRAPPAGPRRRRGRHAAAHDLRLPPQQDPASARITRNEGDGPTGDAATDEA